MGNNYTTALDNATTDAISAICDVCNLDKNQTSAAIDTYKTISKLSKKDKTLLDIQLETFVYIGANIAGYKPLDSIISDLQLTEDEKKIIEDDLAHIKEKYPGILKLLED